MNLPSSSLYDLYADEFRALSHVYAKLIPNNGVAIVPPVRSNGQFFGLICVNDCEILGSGQ